MPRKQRSPGRRPELIVRFVEISSVSARVSIGVVREGKRSPELSSTGHLELTGTMDEVVRNTREVQIVLYSSDDAKLGMEPVPWIGYVHGISPVLRPVFFIAHRDFDRVWPLALSGQLKHAHMVLTQPRYQSAFVVSISFSTHPEE